ncbi:Peptidase S10, serine carboxypeptidase [Drechmeria coniospora]|uniref:Carboxypeptidase n=1 Tax=Drechmeria coniospora TaxID=98403 RepID=A0A151GTQ7_DRECN|nr:Peptidase S10, serine carboxypeptidase [Drechmeria coniospora]KYK60392.1 Peptidase S10, serine carboxypeptidase [Drechmeria coniospora]
MTWVQPLSIAWQWLAVLVLALTPAVTAAAAAKSAADYYVRDLPGLPQDSNPVKMHAGHIEITPDHNGNMFFWHFQNKHIANRQRTVIWVNGGPGCSSEDGALMEIGPYRVREKGNLVVNNGSWNEFANLLFVDNPVGTGFSYVDTDSYVHELDVMADQFVQFLDKFFAIFPEYDQDDIYMAGESYAGQHIPYIAKAILDRNKKNRGKEWKLKGLLIGNGWLSPNDQYDTYLKFAFEKGLLKKGSEQAELLQAKQNTCYRLLGSNPGHVDYAECEDIMSSMLKLLKTGSGNEECYNMYDVRLRDSYPSCGMNWPPDLANMTPYLRRDDVTKALHVNRQRGTGWQECNGAVSFAFRAKNSKPSVTLLPDLIKEIQILLFSGAEDLICNHIGTEQVINNLEWNGGKGFEVTPGNWAPRRNWTFEGEDAGFWQEARNLTYVLFRDASHMVPFDFPRRSRDMLDRFMGVDISSIGGEPTDSRIDGEKGLATSVGGASNQTHHGQAEAQKKVTEAKWAAYRRSGEIVLGIVIVAAAAWGVFIWRQRRKIALYSVLNGEENTSRRAYRMSAMRRKPGEGDLEAAAFDETQLDDLHVESPHAPDGSRYSIGDESDEGRADDGTTKETGSQGNRSGGDRPAGNNT